MTTSTSYRQHRGAGVDERHIGEPIAHLPLDLVDAITVEFEGGALGTVGGTGNGIHRKLDLQIHCERGCIDMDMVADTTVVRYDDGGQEAFDPPTDAIVIRAAD